MSECRNCERLTTALAEAEQALVDSRHERNWRADLGRDEAQERAERAEASERLLREAITAAIDSLTRWNVDDGSMVVDANIRHLRRALAEGGA